MGGDEDATSRGTDGTESRRALLRAIGAASAVAGVGGLAGAQGTTTDGTGQETTTADGQETATAGTERGTATTAAAGEATPILLGGRTDHWLGLAPAPIEGERNPMLRLRSGERYRLVWINLDGARHEWHLENADGNAVESTRAARRVGATRSVTFEADASVASYRCEYHPERMVGPVDLGEGFQTTAATTRSGETTRAEGTTTGTTADAATTAGGGEVTEVAVGPDGQYLRFVPEEVEISVGDTVRWTFESEGHNVTAKPEAATQVELPEGAEPFATYEGNRSFMVMEVGSTFEHTFTVPGTYVYVCAPHAGQGMVATVEVTE